MDFLPADIQAYAEAHSQPEPELLAELNRETHIKSMYPRMLSGHIQGRFLAAISRMLQPSQVVEIGTFTGYSALCFAEGLQAEGRIISYEIDPQNADMANAWFKKAGYQGRVQSIVGDALELIVELEDGTTDLAFIDGRKEEYANYYEKLLPKMRKGGVILTDNVLWSGQVLDKNPTDPAAKALQDFNKFVLLDKRVFNMLLPFRDGVMINIVQ